MEHADHVMLIQKAISRRGGVWADLGSGEGAFTLALRELAGPESKIYSVDINNYRLTVQREKFDQQFPESNISFINTDFTNDLSLPPLGGIIMANSIHYIKDQDSLFRKLWGYLKPHGKLLIVEYNSHTGNPWVPYPLPFKQLQILCQNNGFLSPMLLETIPSKFLNEIYSAVSLKR